MYNFSKSAALFFLFGTLICVVIAFFSQVVGWAMFLTVVLFCYAIFSADRNLFSPFMLYTLFYLTVPVAAILLYFGDLSTNRYLFDIQNANRVKLLESAVIYSCLCYISSFFGYRVFRRKFVVKININDGVSSKLLPLFILLFFLIGLSNFIYNVAIIANGNLWCYMQNISVRYLELKTVHTTTFFYLFSYIACYMWQYYLFKEGKGFSWCWLLYLLLTFLIHISTGRVFSSIVYLLTFFITHYLFFYTKCVKKNFKYFSILVLICSLGVILYFFRLASNLAYNHLLDTTYTDTILHYIFNFKLFTYYSVGSGNMPNIPVLMQILDKWEGSHQLLYGSSTILWLQNILPANSLLLPNYQPSVIIKELWYSGVEGGALPPTGMGEMYMNFGYMGGVMAFFFMGILMSLLHNVLRKYNSYWSSVIYAVISVNFFMLYAKGEFDNMSLWYILPYLLVYSALALLSKRTNFSSVEAIKSLQS